MIGITRQKQRGESLIGILAALAITSIAMAASVSSLMGFSRGAVDARIIRESTVRSRSISNSLNSELRLLGSGMPLTQANFLITSAGLGTAPLPILTTSNLSNLSFRLNLNGRTTALNATFNPASSTSIPVLDASIFAIGDTVYISDAVVSGSNGLQAVISSINLNTIVVSNIINNAGATFAAGSIIEPVTTITYASTTSGITRTEGTFTFTLTPTSTISFRYLDQNGTALALPLTANTIATSLYSIEPTITEQSTVRLSSGLFQSSTLTSKASLRNLILTR